MARGTYRPATCNPCLEEDKQIAFLLPPNVQLYGGFAGNETSRDQRNFSANLTILSGDIGTPADSTDNSSLPTLTVDTPGNYGLTVTEIQASNARDDQFSYEPGNERTQVFNIIQNDEITTSGDWHLNLLTEPSIGVVEGIENGLLSFSASATTAGEATIIYELCSMECPDVCTEATVRISLAFSIDDENIPNAITPNNDGINDTFFFDIIALSDPDDIPDNRLVIFNRWGDIVFERRNYDNTWNGVTQNGEELPHGTYYYILYLNIPEGVIIKGYVTILK